MIAISLLSFLHPIVLTYSTYLSQSVHMMLRGCPRQTQAVGGTCKILFWYNLGPFEITNLSFLRKQCWFVDYCNGLGVINYIESTKIFQIKGDTLENIHHLVALLRIFKGIFWPIHYSHRKILFISDVHRGSLLHSNNKFGGINFTMCQPYNRYCLICSWTAS